MEGLIEGRVIHVVLDASYGAAQGSMVLHEGCSLCCY